MVEEADFKGMCERVARVTGRIDDETRAIYYEAFKGCKRDVLFKAMKRVARDHPFYKFPTISEIADALRDVREPSREKPEYCKTCNGTGLVIVNYRGYDTTFRCSCPNGSKVCSKIRPWADVKHEFIPEDASKPWLPTVPIEALEAMADATVLENGCAVEKTCGSCFESYRAEHPYRVTAKFLKELHFAHPAQCEKCHIEEGRKYGLWK